MLSSAEVVALNPEKDKSKNVKYLYTDVFCLSNIQFRKYFLSMYKNYEYLLSILRSSKGGVHNYYCKDPHWKKQRFLSFNTR